MNKAWIYVFLTCCFELMWVYGFNIASVWWHWVIIIAIILLDFHILPKACATLPTGTVYAVFSGVGTIGSVLMDIFLFAGHFSPGKLFFVGLIVAGVIGLNLADNHDAEKKDGKEAA